MPSTWPLTVALEMLPSLSWALAEAFPGVRVPNGLQGLGSSPSNSLMPRFLLIGHHQHTGFMPETSGTHPATIPFPEGKPWGPAARTVVQVRAPQLLGDSSGLSELHPAHSASLSSPSSISTTGLCVCALGGASAGPCLSEEGQTNTGEVNSSWSPPAGRCGCGREWGPMGSQVRADSGSRRGSLGLSPEETLNTSVVLLLLL